VKSVALTLALIALGLLSLVVHGAIPENKVASDLALAIQQYNAEMAARAGARSEHTVVEVFADISVLSLDVQGRAQIYLDVDKIDSDLLMKLERGGIVIEQIAEEI
jgi:hypothetical protein